MEQQSSEWLEWRKKGIGGSDVAAVLGCSPWKTEHQLWLEKTGRAETKDLSMEFHVQRGHQFEPVARAYLELQVNATFKPKLIVHPKIEHLRVSLDGDCEELDAITEIKVPGADTIEKAKKGLVPDHYMAQIQLQLLCTGRSLCHYVVYDYKTKETIVVEIKPDKKWFEEIIQKSEQFWMKVVSDTEPGLSSSDPLDMSEDEDLNTLTKKYFDLKEKVAEFEAVKKELKEFTKRHDFIKGKGLSIKRFQNKGQVDYSKVPGIAGVDLDKYRKEGSYTVRITEVKK